jgi:hypothetical protein
VKGLGERPSERLPAAAALPGSGLADIDLLRRLPASIDSTPQRNTNIEAVRIAQCTAAVVGLTHHNAPCASFMMNI